MQLGAVKRFGRRGALGRRYGTDVNHRLWSSFDLAQALKATAMSFFCIVDRVLWPPFLRVTITPLMCVSHIGQACVCVCVCWVAHSTPTVSKCGCSTFVKNVVWAAAFEWPLNVYLDRGWDIERIEIGAGVCEQVSGW